MRRFALPLLLFTLCACAPRATVAEPDTDALRFVVLPSGDLAVVGNAPIEYGDVRVAGEALVLTSPYCDLPGCAANENGYVRLTYPDDGKANYGSRLEITVVSGRPLQGRALMTLTGEEKSRPALLERAKPGPSGPSSLNL